MNPFIQNVFGVAILLALTACASEPQTSAPPVAPSPAPTPAPVATAPASPAPASAVPALRKISINAIVHFNANQTTLGKDARHELDGVIDKLKVLKKIEVIIATGHTGPTGTAAAKNKQGMQRANAVKDYLVHKGVPANKIYTDSKGDAQLVTTDKSEAGRAKNRRVEIEVIGFSAN
jgi:OOP family OmpA-OmpF porin